MRLLVTGPRDWHHRPSVEWLIWTHLEEVVDRGDRLVVVRGDASGADDLAGKAVGDLSARGYPVEQEVHYADWENCVATCTPGHRRFTSGSGHSYCPEAGPRRNAEMVAAGADTAAALLKECSRPGCRKSWRSSRAALRPHYSHGTQNCVELIVAAKIPLITIDWEGREIYYVVGDERFL